MSPKKILLICFGIVLAGAAVILVIFLTEPEATRTGTSKETAMLVEVTSVERDHFTPSIRAMGTVMPSQDIILSPRVDGEITGISENFTPGGYVEKGDVLLNIDSADYENALQQRKSELQQAQTELEIEMGRQNVARQDYELLDESITSENRSLVLREPQLNAARANVLSAETAVNQAELGVQRTAIRAPFNAYIISRNTSVGSQVTPGDELARLVGVDTYWVEASLPLSQLRWINIPQNGETGSPVTIRNRTAWEENEHRNGELFRLVGALEDATRLARVLIAVPDPHANLEEHEGQPRLMIGSFVETNIQAGELTDVFRLSRDYLRQNDTVWVMENDTLRIREPEIIFRDAEHAYITDGLSDGARIVTSNLATVVDGSPLRLENTDTTTTVNPDLNE